MRLAYGDRTIANPQPVIGWIRQMGEGLYDHETPDGYDLSSAAWSAPGQMATRFDIARQLGNGAARLFQAPDAAPGTPPPPGTVPVLKDSPSSPRGCRCWASRRWPRWPRRGRPPSGTRYISPRPNSCTDRRMS
ncbi:DUF1800 family protein [Sphingomonas sp. I4]